MSTLMTQNNLVACTPMKQQAISQVVKGGFALVDKKVQLEELKVVMSFSSKDAHYHEGDSVWVRADQSVQPYAKEVFTVDGKEFILVPQTAILLRKCE